MLCTQEVFNLRTNEENEWKNKEWRLRAVTVRETVILKMTPCLSKRENYQHLWISSVSPNRELNPEGNSEAEAVFPTPQTPPLSHLLRPGSHPDWPCVARRSSWGEAVFFFFFLTGPLADSLYLQNVSFEFSGSINTAEDRSWDPERRKHRGHGPLSRQRVSSQTEGAKWGGDTRGFWNDAARLYSVPLLSHTFPPSILKSLLNRWIIKSQSRKGQCMSRPASLGCTCGRGLWTQVRKRAAVQTGGHWRIRPSCWPCAF